VRRFPIDGDCLSAARAVRKHKTCKITLADPFPGR